MIKRAAACTLLLAGACLSFGQLLTAAELEVDQAFKNLRSATQAQFQLTGTDYIGPTATPFGTTLTYNRPLASVAQDLQMELIESRNLIRTRRGVADGRHVWAADLLNNTYSTARYGNYTAVRPTDYEQNAFQSLNVFTADQSVWPARIVREIFGGTTALYRPWIPASTVRTEYTIQVGTGPIADPVVPTRIYTPTPTKKFHMYYLTKSGVVPRAMTFEMDINGGTGAWDLTSIYYSDKSKVGVQNRLIDWKMDIYQGILPTAGNFVYTPAPGARAIASPRPNGSG
jgi:hypothetical protein